MGLKFPYFDIIGLYANYNDIVKAFQERTKLAVLMVKEAETKKIKTSVEARIDREKDVADLAILSANIKSPFDTYLSYSQYNSARRWASFYAPGLCSNGLDPLVVDLDNDGIETKKKEEGAYYDLDNSMFAERTGWVGKDDGLLVLDKNGDGTITGGNELFGDQTTKKDGTTAKNGFDALADYDDNKDGVVDSNDSVFSSLKIWQDANGDGVSQAEELKGLTERGIKSFSLDNNEIGKDDGNGNTFARQGFADREDGSKTLVGEFLFSRDTLDRKAIETAVSSAIEKLMNIEVTGHSKGGANAEIFIISE
jgi:hypothetical protein